jgi:ABC-2 type transport system permease protein
MIAAIARHEFHRLRTGLLFWLLLGIGQGIVAWLAFAQFEAFAAIAPGLRTAGTGLDATSLVIVPTLNSLVLWLVVAVPSLAMGSLAGERRSGRIEAWFSAPLRMHQVAAGKVLGVWLATLPVLASCLLTLALFGLGITVDWTLFLLAVAGLVLLALWMSALGVLCSAGFDHPAAALVTALGILLFLWLLDTLVTDASSGLLRLALLPHAQPWLGGLLRLQDIAYFVVSGGAVFLLTVYTLARRRGEL